MMFRIAVVATAAFVVSHSVLAQDSTKKDTKADTAKASPPKPFAQIHIDLGYVNTSGNTTVSTLNVADGITLRPSQRNEIDQTFAVVYGTSNNVVQTSIWTAQIQDQYKFRPWLGLYALVDYNRNTFAGIKSQFEEGGGVTLTVVDTHHDHLEFAFGISYIELQAADSAGVDSSAHYAAAHSSGMYKHTLIKNTYLQETLGVIPDLKVSADFRITSETDIVAPLSKHLAIKVGYGIQYANLPPPGFKTTDRLLTSDLQVTF